MRRTTRTVLVSAAVVAVAALGVGSLLAEVPASPPGVRQAPTTPQPEPTTTALPPGYTASPLEVDGRIKEAAARFVERVGTWQAPGPVDAVSRVTRAGYPADLAATAEPLIDGTAEEATTSVVYPQYGGLTDTAASVLVQLSQVLRSGTDERVRELVLDIRLAPRADGSWEVTSVVDPPRPPLPPAEPGGPTPLGRAVLDDPRLRISQSARNDIADRRVDDPILAVLSELAHTYTLDVQVMVSGHLGTVFPTTRVSNHAVGRGIDVRAVNGTPVVAIPRDDPLITGFMAAAGRAGATEVGGPLVPAGTGFFTDQVHQDHFHLGITPTKPAATVS